MSAVLPIIVSPLAEKGAVYIGRTLGGRRMMMMHWLDFAMLSFDHDQWWAETPAETARRIANEVLVRHGFDPLPSVEEERALDAR